MNKFIILFTVKCGSDSVFKQCGPNVERSCENSTEDTSVCFAGCFCLNGMVKHEGKCIQLENCPCTSNGLIYKPGGETVSIGKIGNL